MSIRFLHTADWHLGRNSSLLNKEQNRLLNEARFKTVEAIFAYAREENIPLIVSAGDQFDSAEFKSTELLTRLFRIAEQDSRITCIAITGNHDTISPASIYSKVEPRLYPKNVRLVRGGKETIDLAEHNCTIFAASSIEKNGRQNPLAWIPEKPESSIRIGVGHGSLAIPGRFKEDDFPIDPGFVQEKNLDYLALGHWHSFYQSGERACYPGTPQPMKFGEQGSVLDVTIEKPGSIPVIKKTPISPLYTWEKEEFLLDNTNFRTKLEGLAVEKDHVLGELTINGFLSPAVYKEVQQTLPLLPDSWFSLTTHDHTRLTPSPDDIPPGSEIGYLRYIIDGLLDDEEKPPDRTGLSDTEHGKEIKNRALDKLYEFMFEKGLL